MLNVFPTLMEHHNIASISTAALFLLQGDKMPGPVSDSYDPEFGTSANRDDVVDAIEDTVSKISTSLGTKLHNIVKVVQAPTEYGNLHSIKLTEGQLRIIRFSLNRVKETL